MKLRNQGATQANAAARAGISQRSARRIERGEVRRKPRHWRTRKDPFEEVWEKELVPLLNAQPTLSPITLLEHLQEKRPDDFPDSMLRTLQRRVKAWLAFEGPNKAVMFTQRHEPGAMGLSDFTAPKASFRITIAGEPLKHLLYHFRLACSGWRYAKVVLGGESWTALAEGLQEALWRLGGAPAEHRTDSLSAAFRNFEPDQAEDMTCSYTGLCEHYGMCASRNNRGEGHENGGIESPHGHLKHRIAQALALRGSADFDTVGAYQNWLDEAVVNKMNRRCSVALEAERPFLKPLPLVRTRDYSEYVVPVTTASMITVRCVAYTVPSRLIGERLRIHLYDDRLEAHVGTAHALTLPRVYPLPGSRRARRVDYRHIIDSLVRKPRAFNSSILRDELMPSAPYRRAWPVLKQRMETGAACKLMVGALAIAARHDCEAALGRYLEDSIEQGNVPTLLALERRFGPSRPKAPAVRVTQHPLAGYNALCARTAEGAVHV